MKKSYLVLASAICFAEFGVSPAMAFEVKGGDVGLSNYSLFGFGGGREVREGKLDASVEIGFNTPFALQFDLLASSSLGSSHSFNGRAGGVHAIYHVSDDLSVGAFFAREQLRVMTFSPSYVSIYGGEISYDVNAFSFEGYYGKIKSNNAPARSSVGGASIDYSFNDQFAIGVNFERLELGNSRNNVALTTSVALNAAYEVFDNVLVTGEFGRHTSISGGRRGNFVGLGIKYTFGAERGATFGKREMYRRISAF